MTRKVLKVNDFANLLGIKTSDIDQECKTLIKKNKLKYREISLEERDKIMLDILKKLDSNCFLRAGVAKKKLWERGWKENLLNFIKQKYTVNSLVPKYYKKGRVLRLRQRYIMPINPNFEYKFYEILLRWLFEKYIKNTDTIYEFGCGPGNNLYFLAKMFPLSKIVGLDWSKTAVKLINLIGKKHHLRINGHVFNMFSPNYSIPIEKDSIFLTIGCLEQLGNNCKKFIRYVMDKKPKTCIHIEPIIDYYDENNLVDYLAIKVHKARNYLNGYIESLKRLEKARKIKIIKEKRTYFGSIYQDSWSIVVWKLI